MGCKFDTLIAGMRTCIPLTSVSPMALTTLEIDFSLETVTTVLQVAISRWEPSARMRFFPLPPAIMQAMSANTLLLPVLISSR